jgi:hypothetical protein
MARFVSVLYAQVTGVSFLQPYKDMKSSKGFGQRGISNLDTAAQSSFISCPLLAAADTLQAAC